MKTRNQKVFIPNIFRTNNQLYSLSAKLHPPNACYSFWLGSTKYHIEFGSILLSRLILVVDILLISCSYLDLQLSPQIFDGIKVFWLRQAFQNVDLCLIQPFGHHFSLVPLSWWNHHLHPSSHFRASFFKFFSRILLYSFRIIPSISRSVPTPDEEK